MEVKKRIVVIVRSLQLGGAEKQSIFLTRSLLKKYSPVLLVRDRSSVVDKNAQLTEKMNVELVTFHGSKLSASIRASKWLLNARPFAILALLPSDAIWIGIVGMLDLNSRIYVSIRGLQLKGWKFWIIKMFSAVRFSGIFYNSKTSLDYYERMGLNHVPSHYISNAVELPSTLEALETKNEFRILMIARFDPLKDYETAIKSFLVFSKAVKSKTEPRLVIAGYGSMKPVIEQWIKEYEVEKIVQILDGRADTSVLYRSCHCYLSTSVSEGMPNSVMEAMAHAMPVIATDVGDTKRLVLNGLTGYLVSPDDSEGVAEAMEKLFHNPTIRLSMGLRGRELVREKYGLLNLESSLNKMLS